MVIGVFLVAMIGLVGAFAVRSWRGIAVMSDGVSGWTQGQPHCSSNGRFSLRRGERKFFLVPIGGTVEVFDEGLVVRSEMARLELHRRQVESVRASADGTLEVVARGLTVGIKGSSSAVRSATLALSGPARDVD